MAKKPPKTPPPSSPPPPSDDPAAAGSASFKTETYAQPLNEPVVEEGPPGASVDGTADIGVQLVSAGCWYRFRDPLSKIEEADLHEDLARVLAKYDAPDIPCSEEVRLALNLGGIVWRRMQTEFAQAAADEQSNPAAHPPQPEHERTVVDDSVGVGQEGIGQNGGGSTAGRSSVGAEARDLLS